MDGWLLLFCLIVLIAGLDWLNTRLMKRRMGEDARLSGRYAMWRGLGGVG